jgi:NMD protein affecting ribosome stability and mRNA decay
LIEGFDKMRCGDCGEKTKYLTDDLCPSCYRKKEKLDRIHITRRDGDKYRKKMEYD